MYKTVIKTTEDFKNKAKEIFGDYYDYTKTDILKKDSKRRLIITCPIYDCGNSIYEWKRF